MTRPTADRRLGSTDVAVPPLVLGGMFRDASARAQEIERVLDFALDHGLHALDTAPLYGFGEGERLIGQWLRGRRERVTLLGKVGLRWDGELRRRALRVECRGNPAGRPAGFASAVGASRRRGESRAASL